MQHNVHLFCLFRTDVQALNIDCVVASVYTSWHKITNYSFHHLGRVSILHKDAVQVQLIFASSQFIPSSIFLQEDISLASSVCMLQMKYLKGKSLWEIMSALPNGASLPWVILGDINTARISLKQANLILLMSQIWVILLLPC